jgi:rod shape-determining protein MreC
MAGARRTSRRRYILLVIVLTAITLITLDTRNGRSGPLGVLGRGAHTVVAPVQSAVSSVARPMGDWLDGVTDAGDIKSENRKLKGQVQKLEGNERSAQLAITENQDLKKLLGLSSIYDVKRVNARIIGENPGNFSPTLTVDRGTEAGVAVGMPVVAPDGSVVGRVIDAGRKFATIRPITDPQFAVGVRGPAHAGSQSATGTAQGQQGSDELVVNDFDIDSKLEVGDPIVTSPLSLSDPPDIPVGTVTKIVNNNNISRTVYVKPYADLGGLDYVSVMLWVKGQGAVVVTTTTTTTTTTPSTTTTTIGRP